MLSLRKSACCGNAFIFFLARLLNEVLVFTTARAGLVASHRIASRRSRGLFPVLAISLVFSQLSTSIAACSTWLNEPRIDQTGQYEMLRFKSLSLTNV